MNPWLGIPEADYFGHMSSPNVGQYGVLNRLLRDALTTARPRHPSRARLLGRQRARACRSRDHVAGGCRRHQSGVSEATRERFPQPGFELQLQCADLDDCQWAPATFDLVHAALVFEYVDWAALLQQVAVALRPAGMLSVVLQRPLPDQPEVTPSPFSSLQSLASIFRFVDPGALAVQARSNGLQVVSQRTEVLSSGKAFEVIRLRRDSA